MRRAWLVVIPVALAACAGEIRGGVSGAADAGRDAGDGAAVDAGPADAAPVAVDAPPPPIDAAPDAFVALCPPVGPLDCSPGPGTGTGDECVDGTSCFLNAVKSAVTGVIAAHPEWFDTGTPTGCPLILDVDGFMDAVVADLTGQGLCAIRDPNAPGEEVTVKHDNAYSENFDIVASTGCARWGDLIYTSTCAPAWW